MKYQFISFDELQNKLERIEDIEERIEDIEERIEKLSFEIFQCNSWITRLRNGLKNLSIQRIELYAFSTDIDQEVSEILQNNKTISKNCSEYLSTALTECMTEPFNEFLEQTEQLLHYYLTIADIRNRKIDKRNGSGMYDKRLCAISLPSRFQSKQERLHYS